ncbi:MAG: hypothetical protein NWQ26_01730, partial [Paraglaciecola sp.]|nr:hypothetical protein [Paraglaciecola sp.]
SRLNDNAHRMPRIACRTAHYESRKLIMGNDYNGTIHRFLLLLSIPCSSHIAILTFTFHIQ